MDFIIFDIEYTSWEGSLQRDWGGINEFKEIVQISGIKTSNFETLHKSNIFSIYCKPKLNPKLSNYFKRLTSISQETIDKEGIEIEKGIKLFSNFIKNCHCLSWGNDFKIIKENQFYLKKDYNFDAKSFSDIKELFKEYIPEINSYNSSDIHNYFPNVSLLKPGIKHNALSDCFSLCSALNKIAIKFGNDYLIKRLIDLKNK